MSFSFIRVVQATTAATVLETLFAVIRSYSFNMIPVIFYLIIEFVFLFAIICIGGFVVGRISQQTFWARRLLFFGIVVSPSIISYLFFYSGVSYYEQNGNTLVMNHHLTSAGIGSIFVNMFVSAIISTIATAIYFRTNSPSKQDH